MPLLIFSMAAVITIIFPLLAIPLDILGIIFSKGKVRKAYGFLLALSLAIVAYIWEPDPTMDLYRFHQQVISFSDFDFGRLFENIGRSLEPAHYVIEFLVAQTRNYNLLQFLVVLIGYYEMFWLIMDYSDLKQVKKSTFILLFLYAFAALRFIDFASGLWFNFAMINTALGVYLQYFRKTKYLQYIFYIIAVLLHIGTLYMMVVMILIERMKMFKKMKVSSLVVVLCVALSFGILIVLLSNMFGSDSPIVKIAEYMYNGYFVSNENNESMITSINYWLRIVTMFLSLLLAIWSIKKETMRDYGSFVAYFTIYVSITTFSAAIFARYGFLIVLLTLPLIANFLNLSKNKIGKIALVALILVISGLRFTNMAIQIRSVGLSVRINDNMASSFPYMIDRYKEGV